MSTFEDREKAFENKFKYDQDMLFKINSRRARLIGLWAAERLGITAEDKAEAYALEVVSADLDEPGHADIIRKLQADFTAKGLDISNHRITKELERQWEVARLQIAPPAPV
ncbi:MAG: DUF1476 domain-containing protein [Rhodospirillaceae bacterium]